jgi:hypothetical protein
VMKNQRDDAPDDVQWFRVNHSAVSLAHRLGEPHIGKFQWKSWAYPSRFPAGIRIQRRLTLGTYSFY